MDMYKQNKFNEKTNNLIESYFFKKKWYYYTFVTVINLFVK